MSGVARTAALIALAGLGAGGCMTDHGYVMIGGPEKAYYGYLDTPTADGGHTVRVIRPDPDTAMAYWERRAQELCGGKVKRKIIHTAVRPTVLYEHYGGRPGDFNVEGMVYCESEAAPAAEAVVEAPPAAS